MKRILLLALMLGLVSTDVSAAGLFRRARTRISNWRTRNVRCVQQTRTCTPVTAAPVVETPPAPAQKLSVAPPFSLKSLGSQKPKIVEKAQEDQEKATETVERRPFSLVPLKPRLLNEGSMVGPDPIPPDGGVQIL